MISLFLRDQELDEDELVQIIKHMNLFTCYYDDLSQMIPVYTQPAMITGPSGYKYLRYPHGDPPRTIAGKPVNPYLLDLWESSRTVDPIRQFLHSYQVLEFAAFYYLDSSTRDAIRSILLDPGMLWRIDGSIGEILDLLVRRRDEIKRKSPTFSNVT